MIESVAQPVFGNKNSYIQKRVLVLDGPIRGYSVDWSNGITIASQFTVPENLTESYVDVFGALSINDSGVRGYDGSNYSHYSYVYESNETVVVKIEVTDSGLMRVGDQQLMGEYSRFGSNYFSENLISSALENWEKVTGVASGASGLWLSGESGEATHTNSALDGNYSTSDFRSFELTIGNNPTNARIAFGTDVDNFVFFGQNGTIYNVKSGAFYSTSVGYVAATTFATGDKIRVTIFGSPATPVVQVFKNGTPLGCSVLARADLAAVLPDGDISCGCAWRDYATTWYATASRYDDVAPYRYVHLSLDDVLPMLIESLEYDSLWDQENFALIKHLHDNYGAKFSLYCFAVEGSNDITNMTDKHKSYFVESKDWLKLGFHAYDSSTTYNSGITAETAKSHYDTVINAIKYFAGEYSVDLMPRIHSFAGTLDQCLAWKDSGIEGIIAADDTRVSYYHNTAQNACITKSESLYDYTNDLHFCRSAFRLEYISDVQEKLNALINQSDTVKGQTKELVVFTHAYLFSNYYGSSTGVEEKLESVCQWAKTNNVPFDYPFLMRRRGRISASPSLVRDATINPIVAVIDGFPSNYMVDKILNL